MASLSLLSVLKMIQLGNNSYSILIQALRRLGLATISNVGYDPTSDDNGFQVSEQRIQPLVLRLLD